MPVKPRECASGLETCQSRPVSCLYIMWDVLLIQLAMYAEYYMHSMPDGLAWYMQVHVVKTRVYTYGIHNYM